MTNTTEVDAPATPSQSDRTSEQAETEPPRQELSRVLLLDPDEVLNQTRALLFQSLGMPVDVTTDLATLWKLRREIPYCLVAVSIRSNLKHLPSVLTAIRTLWPAARVLLLGNRVAGIEDNQYDEIIDAAYRPRALIEMAQRLISPSPYVTGK